MEGVWRCVWKIAHAGVRRSTTTATTGHWDALTGSMVGLRPGFSCSHGGSRLLCWEPRSKLEIPAYTNHIEEAVAGADLLSEAVPERLKLKREVHKQLDAVCPSRTILTTNTSYLLVSEIEDVVGRGDRFAAMHFHLGGALVDIVGGRRTSAETIDTLKRFVRSLQQTPVVGKKEKDGYLFNSMFMAMCKEAFLLVIDGYADFRDVDRSFMAAIGHPVGPFSGMDRVGLDVCLDVCQAQSERHNDPDMKRVADFLRPFIERGDLGWKTGKGFYDYPEPEYEKKEFLLGAD